VGLYGFARMQRLPQGQSSGKWQQCPIPRQLPHKGWQEDTDKSASPAVRLAFRVASYLEQPCSHPCNLALWRMLYGAFVLSQFLTYCEGWSRLEVGWQAVPSSAMTGKWETATHDWA
jgi:hypothetical protein